jgi:hypothetical protein
MIKIEIEADTLQDLVAKVIIALGIGQRATAPAPVANPEPEAAPVVDEPAKKRVGRPAKAKAAEPVESLPLPTEGEPEKKVSTLTVTFDDMLKAINTYVQRADGGLLKAKEILTGLGYERVKDVKPEHFAAVVEACK